MQRWHAKQTKAPAVGDLQKVSSNESTAKREINWKWMLSASPLNSKKGAAAESKEQTVQICKILIYICIHDMYVPILFNVLASFFSLLWSPAFIVMRIVLLKGEVHLGF